MRDMIPRDVSFHEATVVAFDGGLESIRLNLSDVHKGERKIDIVIEIQPVRDLVIDSVPAESVAMEYADGEILTLDIEEEKCNLIVQWNDFSTHRSVTRSYVIHGDVHFRSPFTASEPE